MKRNMINDTQQMPRLLLGICLSLFLAISAFGQTSQYAGTYTGNFEYVQSINTGNNSGTQIITSNSPNTFKIDGQGNLIDVYNSDGTPWGLRNRPNFAGGTIDSNGRLVCNYSYQRYLGYGSVYEWISYTSTINFTPFGAVFGSEYNDDIQGYWWDADGTQHTVGSIDQINIGSDYLPRDVAQTSDPAGRPGDLFGDPIDLATGGHYISEKLLTIQGARRLDFIAGYESNLLGADQLGLGWGHNFEANVSVGDQPNTLVLHWNANRQNSFTASGTAGVYTSTDFICSIRSINTECGRILHTGAERSVEVAV